MTVAATIVAVISSLHVSTASNFTIRLGTNNVVNFPVSDPSGVELLAVTSTLAACEAACLRGLPSGKTCLSFTWHHTDFEKAKYRGHCYAHTDAVWAPTTQQKIDSGCRVNLPPSVRSRPNCSALPGPPPPPPPLPPSRCQEDFDCSGANGRCVDGICHCRSAWAGPACGQLNFVPHSGRVACASICLHVPVTLLVVLLMTALLC